MQGVKCIHVCFRCVWRSICKKFCFSSTWQVILILGLIRIKDYSSWHMFVYFMCVQLWWQARQADAACLDDTTFTPLMGFYMSFPETAATCWPETANIDPSHCWVRLLDDGCDMTCVEGWDWCSAGTQHACFLEESIARYSFHPLFDSSDCCYLGKLLTVLPTGDLVGGKRTGVTLFLEDAFELHLSVDGQLSQGDQRLLICGEKKSVGY